MGHYWRQRTSFKLLAIISSDIAIPLSDLYVVATGRIWSEMRKKQSVRLPRNGTSKMLHQESVVQQIVR
jgi:hypothetical protein